MSPPSPKQSSHWIHPVRHLDQGVQQHNEISSVICRTGMVALPVEVVVGNQSSKPNARASRSASATVSPGCRAMLAAMGS